MADADQVQDKLASRLVIFRNDGEDLDHDTMPYEGVDDSVLKGFELTGAAGIGDGQVVRCLFREPQPDGLSLCHAWFKSGFMLPRHSHSADCIYYVLAGAIQMGGAVLGKGDGLFVPADHGYTFQAGPDGAEILEFRNATRFNIVFKGNTPAFWQKIADAAEAARGNWPNETVPPSQR